MKPKDFVLPWIVRGKVNLSFISDFKHLKNRDKTLKLVKFVFQKHQH